MRARRSRIQGRVLVEFDVDEEGRVQNPTCQEGSHPLLCDAAIAAVAAASFEPGTQAGVPVMIHFTLPIDFKLR